MTSSHYFKSWLSLHTTFHSGSPASLEWVLPPDGSVFGKLQENGTWTGIMRMLTHEARHGSLAGTEYFWQLEYYFRAILLVCNNYLTKDLHSRNMTCPKYAPLGDRHVWRRSLGGRRPLQGSRLQHAALHGRSGCGQSERSKTLLILCPNPYSIINESVVLPILMRIFLCSCVE